MGNIMNNTELSIKCIVEKQMNTAVSKMYPIGKGASGSVYCVEIKSEPYKLAVKMSEHYDATLREKEMLDFLSSRVSYKVPKTYFVCRENGTSYLAMELIEGISGKNVAKLFFLPNKKHLANNIVDAFMNTQSFHNDKFGKFDNPAYDTWKEYYNDFFNPIYKFTKEKYKSNEVSKTVMNAVQLIYDNFDLIFDDAKGEPTLCHGDFWMPNMVIDFKKSELAGVIDPFNIIYAEPEYELFSLTLGFGKKLKLYNIYKSRVSVSKYCDLKVELYALCNELDWYMWLNSIGHNYLKFRAENLINQFGKFGIK